MTHVLVEVNRNTRIVMAIGETSPVRHFPGFPSCFNPA